MKWRKLGKLFVADNLSEQLKTHACTPLVVHLEDDHHRIYYTGRDEHYRSSVCYIDVLIKGDEVTVLDVPTQPILTPGAAGTFDDSGCSLACVLYVEGRYLMYYLGWNLGVTVPWRNSIGLAISNDGINFERYSQAPILDRNHVDPFTISYPWVMKEGDKWHMWYGSNLKWGKAQEDMDHLLKYASSKNGIDWTPSGEIAVPFKDKSEYAISKPCVIKENGIYKMWYSYRGDDYRIGYAESCDAIHFERKDDEVGIDVARHGWDSQSIEYPCIIDHKSERYLFYNGNNYGITGFGVALLEQK